MFYERTLLCRAFLFGFIYISEMKCPEIVRESSGRAGSLTMETNLKNTRFLLFLPRTCSFPICQQVFKDPKNKFANTNVEAVVNKGSNWGCGDQYLQGEARWTDVDGPTEMHKTR